jgi:acyl-CoA thioesterase I
MLQPANLPASGAALAAGRQWLIVALGSSSTAAATASTPAESYPAQLQRILSAALPRASLAVINRGRNGEDVGRELLRLESDVIAIRPAFVMRQVGANAALRATPPSVFRHLLTIGLARLRAARADVILMDNQCSPRIIASSDDAAIDGALASAARSADVTLFSRTALMDTWQREGFPYRDFIAHDLLHQNDLGYGCVAEALAHMILEGIDQHAAYP